MHVNPGDWIEYHYEGQAYRAEVTAVLYAGTMMARIEPAHKSHPSLVPLSKCRQINSPA